MACVCEKPVSAVRSFVCDGEHFVLDGKPFRIFSGELHYFRVPREYWKHRLQCARAMGLNTISTYMPWNLHEPKPGVFDFSGMLDIAAFLALADEVGLKVILRPGPYICAEWEFGGLPSWLLAIPGIKVRCLNPDYMRAVERYFAKVGEVCASWQYQNGGPVILVQVENEYGAFGNDRAYMDRMVRLVREVGFSGQLYTCDWAKPANLKAGEVADAVTVANFGSRAEEQLTVLKKLRPNQPVMCGEFWAGWFDAWGKPRAGSPDAAPVLKELEWMLEHNASFNFYMFHGGTSFGQMAGANHYESYAPTVSSYDYWAPLDEAGRTTPKYHAIRNLLARFSPSALPEPAEPPFPFISVPRFTLDEVASLRRNLPEPVSLPQPKSLEDLGVDYGAMLYRTDIAGLGDQKLRIVEAHDFATVFLNDAKVASLSRSLHEDAVDLVGVPQDRATLDIFVDMMGRTNFGPKILDRKGITDRVEYGELTLMGWECFPIPFTAEYLSTLSWEKSSAGKGPSFYRGHVTLETLGDTYLDLGAFTRGVVWINGRCLSRFWKIGPQQTAYLPAVWLKKGVNEVVVFDVEDLDSPSMEGLSGPVNDALGL